MIYPKEKDIILDNKGKSFRYVRALEKLNGERLHEVYRVYIDLFGPIHGNTHYLTNEQLGEYILGEEKDID